MEKMILKEIDEIDKSIIEMLQKDPSITHSDIAKELDRSQPAIGARIKKLAEKGILATQMGVDFHHIDALNLVKIELTTSKPQEVIKIAEHCPYIINILKLSGKANLIVFMACSSLKRIDFIVDKRFRSVDYISSIRMDLITGIAKKFVLPISFCIEDFEDELGPCLCCKECPYEDDITPKKTK